MAVGTLVRNISGMTQTLPFPYSGIIPAGTSQLLTDPVATVEAHLGGSASTRNIFDLLHVADSSVLLNNTPRGGDVQWGPAALASAGGASSADLAAVANAAAVAAEYFHAIVSVTPAEVSSGAKDLLATVPTGKHVHLDGFKILIVGSTEWVGMFSALTIEDKAGTPVPMATISKNAFSELTHAVILPSNDTVTLVDAYVTGGTAGKGLKIAADGTCTDGSTLQVLVYGRLL